MFEIAAPESILLSLTIRSLQDLRLQDWQFPDVIAIANILKLPNSELCESDPSRYSNDLVNLPPYQLLVYPMLVVVYQGAVMILLNIS